MPQITIQKEQAQIIRNELSEPVGVIFRFGGKTSVFSVTPMTDDELAEFLLALQA